MHMMAHEQLVAHKQLSVLEGPMACEPQSECASTLPKGLPSSMRWRVDGGDDNELVDVVVLLLRRVR
jgi:hypothetical protein